MDVAAGNGAEAGREDWWGEVSNDPLSPSPAATTTASAAERDILSSAAARAHNLLANVADNMHSGFILLNQNQRVTYSNASAGRLLGVSVQELLEEPVFDIRKQLLSIAADPQSIQATLDRAWQHPEQECSADLALAHAAARWLRVQCFPVRDPRGHLLGRGVLLDDITLERSTIEARSETLAMAAHELKTPLAIIKGCATTLLGNSSRWDPAVQREMLQMIDTHTDRLYDILNTLLDVWRLDAGTQHLRLALVEFPRLLSQVVERWRKHAPSHVFTLTLPEAMPPVLCDVVRIEQAINHLLNNAVKYSQPGSLITIQLDVNEIELCLSVSDRGVGIAPEQLDRIFERFYRVPIDENSPGGSGLGLAVARATIEAHGGKIWADSPGPGHGSIFYFTLPLNPRSSSPLPGLSVPSTLASFAPAPSASVQSGPLHHSERLHVLIGEHDTRLIRFLRANLEEQQYHVQVVAHGLQLLRQLDLEEPDLILLSTRLLDMSGVELLQRLREYSRIPVLMLADACDEDERVRLLDLGADDLVIKPFGMKELLARVRALLRRQPLPPEGEQKAHTFSSGDLLIDYAQHQVFVEGRPIQLSRTEYRLLSVLARNAGMVITHELLLERVWGPEYNRDIGFIWVYISRLRRKIEKNPREPRYILTVPDVGYKLAKI
ncbi:MAG TPA: ATP-binding protein [Ktedonobacteraceae bacterium]|nr:ATP-binding protein [Ktedonobacteraceae bacterium]